MLLYVLATFCISIAAGYSVLDNDFIVLNNYTESLAWPTTYSVKASKLSLTSNLVEDFQSWKTNTSTRTDYNSGAVKKISFIHFTKDGEEIVSTSLVHPETIDGEDTVIKCYTIDGFFELDDDVILPAIEEDEDYETIGTETILEKETTKFEFIGTNPLRIVRKTIWAAYEEVDDEEYVWIPVRYEFKTFNNALGSLIRHEIWDFYEFTTSVDDKVFEIESYDCLETTTEHVSEKTNKELVFINPDNQKHVDTIFHKYIIDFEREYAHEVEHVMRKDIFNENMRMVAAINRKNLGYKLTINQFSDRTPEELERSTGLKRRAPGKSGNVAFPYDEDKLKEIDSELPDEYDLRLLDLVTPVVNQEDCGSCWTFGTTSAMEGALARVNGGRLLSLSNQALIDCVWVYGAGGCAGGSDNAAYEWMMDYGLPTEEEYGSYKNKDGFCRIANMTRTFPIQGYTDVTPYHNEATKVAVVNHGPLSVSVHASSQFKHYSGGIFYEHDCSSDRRRLNHEVTLVGYGQRDGDLFWILKNSWGTGWGIDGYMLISAKDNICGITTEPTYVVL